MQKVSIALAIALLLCLAPMPYGYFMLVRLAVAVILGYYAVIHKRCDNSMLMIACVAIALLFQPFLKIPLGRTLWNAIDLVVAISLIFWLTPKQEKC